MQSSYQFIHLETFSDYPRKNSKRPSAEAVARECQRIDDAYPHIQKPQQPELIYGIQPLEALVKARLLAQNCKDPIGRKIRKDAQIICFGVASVKVESTPENWRSDSVQRWIKDTTQFLKKRFGDSFISLTAHFDEKYIHLHIGLGPTINDDGSINLTSFHPGLHAQRACKSKKKSVKDHAYKSAMRTFQDEYFEAVGLINGQLRYGPRRRRLTRKEWYSQRHYAALLSKLFKQQTSLISSLNKKLNKAKELIGNMWTQKIKNNKSNDFNVEGV